MGPVLKVVGGEAVDQILQGIAYKAGQSFNNQSALEKARDRWNLEGYQRALEYEEKLNAEERERWERFNNEVKNAKVEPIPNKPGWGKVLLSGAAFLTGVDLIYNAAAAFQAGYNSGENVETYKYSNTGYNGVYMHIEERPDGDLNVWATVVFADGSKGETSKKRVFKSSSDKTLIEPYLYVSSSDEFTFIGVRARYSDGSTVAFTPDTTFHKPLSEIDVPIPSSVKATATDGAINTPEAFRNLGIVPNTTNVPDISPILPRIKPDTFIEIEVPLDPTVIPAPEELPLPLTEEELNNLINPDSNPGQDPIPNPNPNPDPDPNPNPEPEPIEDPFPQPDRELNPEDISCERVKKPEFEKLGNAFSTAFPFSLPFDIYRFLSASFDGIDDNKPEFQLKFLGNDVVLTIPDVFDNYVKYLRTFILIMFDISLLYLFARFMRKGTD